MRLRGALRSNSCVVAVAVAAAALRLSVVLFVPPVVGLANNADFQRVMARVGLDYLTDRYDERYWGWSLTRYAVVDPSPFHTEHVTTEVPLAWAAVCATRLLSSRPIFDVRALGGIHSALFLGALALLLRGCRDLPPTVQWLAAAAGVFVFTDVGYIAAFNSLYGQTSSLLAVLWAAAIAALSIRSGRMTLAALAAYYGAAVWFVGSKPQECLQAPILAFFGWRLWRAGAQRRSHVPALALSLALLAFAGWVYKNVPRLEIHDVGVYHTVFMDLLPNSPDPIADLRALGVDPALVRYSNRHAYLKDSPLGDPGFRAAFFDRVGYPKLVGFYLARPVRLWDRLERAGSLAFQLRPSNLGNLDQASGAPRLYQYQHASTWSRWRLAFGWHGIFWIAGLLGGSVLMAAATWRAASGSGRLFREAVIVLACVGGLEFSVCVFADYLGDLPRHLYLFQGVFDLLGIVCAAWIARDQLRGSVPSPKAEHVRPAEAL